MSGRTEGHSEPDRVRPSHETSPCKLELRDWVSRPIVLQGVSTSTRSRRQAQPAGAAPTPRAQTRRRRLSVRVLPEQPERPEQQASVSIGSSWRRSRIHTTATPWQMPNCASLQAGACIDLTESLDDDDDDEPVLLASKRSSSPVLVQPQKAQQSVPSSASKPKRKRRPQCGICMEDFKSMACGPCG